MPKSPVCCAILFCLFLAVTSNAQTSTKPAEPAFPYTPSLDVTSMDKSIDPCVDLYHYSCGGWQKKNPIPADQTSWSVYGKLYEDNLNFLRGILQQAATGEGTQDQASKEIGSFYAACTDEATLEKRGAKPIQPSLDAIARLKSTDDIAGFVAHTTLPYGRSLLFEPSSAQDPDDSEQEISDLDQGGLRLPDRDYYTKDDDKSKEIRERYLQHVEKMFGLLGDDPATAKANAATILRMETDLAKASLTRVERRDPYKLKNKMKLADLEQLTPKFDWKTYYRELHYPKFEVLNVDSIGFYKQLNTELATEPLANWKTYFRFQVVDTYSAFLSRPFVQENFDFYRRYLRGAKEEQPRWKRCVQYTDFNLSDALGQAYVAKVFSPALKQSTVDMVKRIETAMGQRIQQLDWMSPATKEQALVKLAGIRNKIGYPDQWRDYSSIKLSRDDFAGDIKGTAIFEQQRQIQKIGKPVDHGEWDISSPTVDAYYNPQMNDVNFPAGVLQPPLYDPKMDDAPNYGNTGGTIGHELTHGFDDEGSQFDAKGNLKQWWTKDDRAKFDSRTQCVDDQYSKYVAVDDMHINGKLTLGENAADLGGEILAYIAWKDATKDKDLQPIDGLTPDQRFFVGYAQWDCANDRPEQLRLQTNTDPHSPAEYRINGVVVNMPEFAHAFSCKAGQPMVNDPAKTCRVW